jgi:hypothetical protein
MNATFVGFSILFVILLILANQVFTKSNSKSPTKGLWTIYGSKNCGWTRKQLDSMNKPYVFKDCDKGECPPELTSFPTSVSPSGKVVVGFSNL